MASAADVEQALDRFSGELERKKNVVGLGRQPTDEAEAEWRLIVYVAEKVPEVELAAEDRVPRTLELEDGERTVSVRTDVVELGPVTLE